MAQAENDVVSGEQYRYALTNFRIAHERVAEQRLQLQEQEKQVALLRARIALLEGTGAAENRAAGEVKDTVDDVSIKKTASALERSINAWAANIVQHPPVPLNVIRHVTLQDIYEGYLPTYNYAPTGLQVQGLLRHAMSLAIAEGILNCLIVTDSAETNIQLSRIHEHIFSRDPTVAAVWRRQTFSAAVETYSAAMTQSLLREHIPNLMALISSQSSPELLDATLAVVEAAYGFSRMVHGAPSTSDAFYRAFVPEVDSTLSVQQVELVKRCIKLDGGHDDRVGATVFPGLVKVTHAPTQASGEPTEAEAIHTVVRRAQVICQCALGGPHSGPNVLPT